MKKAKKIKAEAFDVMQYFYGSVHEPLIHCVIRFSEQVDEIALKKAVTSSMNRIPVLGCCFDTTGRRPYWKNQDFRGEDIVQVVEETSYIEAQKTELLATKIDIAKEPQLKIYIIRGLEGDTLCIIINHMVCDASGFKEYLYLLSSVYTEFKNDVKKTVPLESGSRGTSQLFYDFNLKEKLGILLSKYDLSKQKQQLKYPLTGDKSNPIFLSIELTEQELGRIKSQAKSLGVTVNDLIITAYACVLHRKTGAERLVIPCPVDLRKYLDPNQIHGICNLTSNFICDINMDKKASFENTLMQISTQIKAQKASTNCLKSVIMLEKAMRLVPFSIMQRKFKDFFTIPMISFTNIGVVDKDLLSFGDNLITNMYITGAVKYVPYFQIAVSTFDNRITLSSNLYGTAMDKLEVEKFLVDMKNELEF